MCDMTHAKLDNEAAQRLDSLWDMTHSCVSHAAFIYVVSHIRMCDMSPVVLNKEPCILADERVV